MQFFFFRAGSFDNQEVEIESEVGLNKALDTLVERQGAAELSHSGGGPRLFVGVAEGCSSLAYYPSSKTEPYRVIRNGGTSSGDLVVFNIGNTATEIERSHCVPIECMRTIVVHFHRTRELLDSKEWVWEIDPG